MMADTDVEILVLGVRHIGWQNILQQADEMKL